MKKFINSISVMFNMNTNVQQTNSAILAKGHDCLLVSSIAPFGEYPQEWNRGIKSFRAKFNTFKEVPSTLRVPL